MKSSRSTPFYPLLLGALGGSALARAPEPAVLPVVMVTASKQAQTLESVPASITVFDGATLEAAGATGLEAIERITPGLSFQPFGQAGVHAPVMRGMSAAFFSFSSSTLLLIDGVPTLMAQGFDDNLLGIERIEVLRGPQGTLYGRNAEAGVIALHSTLPDNTARAMLSLDAGSRARRALRATLSQPLVTNRLYASVAVEKRRQDGFIDNTWRGGREDGRASENLKLALRWTPDPLTDATLRYRRFAYDDGAALWGAPTAERATVRSGTPGWNRSRGASLSLDVARELGDGLRLRSITARSDTDDRTLQDTDFLPADSLHIGRDHHFRTVSQELRLEGKLERAQWLAGWYAGRDEHDLMNEQKLPAALTRSPAGLSGHADALFGDWRMPLAPAWTLQAGARYERDTVQFATPGNAVQHSAWTRLSPKLALHYQASPGSQWYAQISDGFRAGGYNVFVPAANYSAYAPETVHAVELGVKGWTARKRLRYAAALYRMNVGNMQVQQMPRAGLVYLTNAASAHASGAEFEADLLLGAGWQLRSALALDRTRFARFRDGASVYDGKHNPFAPDRTGHLALRYEAAAGWHLQSTLSGTSAVFLDAANRYRRNGYGLLDLRAGIKAGQQRQYDISAHVNNLAGRRYDAVGYQNGIVTVYSPPREIGLRITWNQ